MANKGGSLHYLVVVGIGGLILTAILLSGYGMFIGGARRGTAMTSVTHISGNLGRDISFALAIDENTEIQGELPSEDCTVELTESHVLVEEEVQDINVTSALAFLSEAENLDEELICGQGNYMIKKEDGVLNVEQLQD